MRFHWRRRIGVAALLTVLLFGLAFSQIGAQRPTGSVLAKFRSGDTVIIPASETVPHDLYVAAGEVHIDGRIEGDLFVAGGTIDVTGPVTGDLFIGGGTVTVSGPVGRHLRVGGGNVSVSGPVELDVLAGAGTLSIGPGARLNGDLVFGAGQVVLSGAVAGSVLGSAQSYTKTGTIGGTEEVTLNQATTPAPAPTPTLGARLLGHAQRYVSIIVAGALLVLLAPALMRSAATRMRERPMPTFGVGVLGVLAFVPALLAVLIAMVLLAIPLGQLGLGRLVMVVVFGGILGVASATFLFLMLALLVAAALVGLAIGELTADRANLAQMRRPYLALALGVLAVVVVTALPVVGWVINFVVLCFGVGALVAVVWSRMRSRSRTATAEPLASGA